jgi:hypothetical protein
LSFSSATYCGIPPFPDCSLTAIVYTDIDISFTLPLVRAKHDSEGGSKNITVEEPLVYRSYLLCLWQVSEEAGLGWRASLEVVKTGEKRGFTSLEELITYLRLSTELPNKESEDQTNR